MLGKMTLISKFQKKSLVDLNQNYGFQNTGRSFNQNRFKLSNKYLLNYHFNILSMANRKPKVDASYISITGRSV